MVCGIVRLAVQLTQLLCMSNLHDAELAIASHCMPQQRSIHSNATTLLPCIGPDWRANRELAAM
jgi:hypothetical protein